jgi:hypothetical protein
MIGAKPVTEATNATVQALYANTLVTRCFSSVEGKNSSQLEFENPLDSDGSVVW